MLRVIVAVVKKNLKQARRDPRFIAPSLIIPFAFLLVYTTMIASIGGGESFACGLVIQDQTPQADEMADIIENMVSTTNHTWFSTTRYDSEIAFQMFQSGELVAYVLIPAGFGANITSGRKTHVIIFIANGNDDVVKNYIHRIETAILLYNQGAVYPEFNQSESRVALNETLTLPTTPSNLAYMTSVVVLLSVITCSLSGQALTTAADFETKAIYETFNSPSPKLAIIIGRTLAAIPKSLIVLLVMVPVALLGYELPCNSNFFVLLLVLLLTILAFVPIGELIGMMTKKREQALLGSVLFTVVTFIAGGGLAPIGLVPMELKAVLLFFPTTHAINMWTRVFFLGTTTGLMPAATALLVTWFLASLLAVRVMNREVERS